MRCPRWIVPSVALLGVTLGATAVSARNPKDLVIVPAGSARYTPLDPADSRSPQLAIVSGDRRTGPVTFFLKLEHGVTPMHWHSSDYTAVLLDGELKHYLRGKDFEATANSAGAAWFQPGGSAATAHADDCVSETCTLFVTMAGKLDLIPTEKRPPADCASAISNALTLTTSDDDPDRAKMPAAKRATIRACVADHWPVAAIECLNGARSKADLRTCQGKLSAHQKANAEKAATDAMAHPDVEISGDLPASCQDYAAAMQRLMTCDAMPQASKDALKQGFEAMSAAWANVGTMPADARAAMADGCRAGADALQQTGSAVCGW